MKSYTVIGLGRFGTHLAKSLYELGEDVLVIDSDESLIDKISDNVTYAVAADARNKEILEKLGAAETDIAVVTCASDLTASILITLNLKNLGAKHIICKAQDETHAEILKKLGADRVIMPEREMAEKLSSELASPNIVDLIDLSDDYGIAEITVPKKWIGSKIKELNIRAEYGITVIAVKNGGSVNISPSAECKFSDGDILVILGAYKDIDVLK